VIAIFFCGQPNVHVHWYNHTWNAIPALDQPDTRGARDASQKDYFLSIPLRVYVSDAVAMFRVYGFMFCKPIEVLAKTSHELPSI
jgi:hypothetical protein